ncbi:MAG: TIR domain-containing protein [Desulfuromonadales bacterium]|nr:TIR domain-containing protein [Desulfuromonadales bacterium]
MSDVFISYSSEDRERARTLAASLQRRGWSVWWDRKIVPGQSFDLVIERELETAKCAVVLWSEQSITSDWVKNEAASAAERGILVPALIDSVKIPLEFRRKQTADLTGFDGDTSHNGFQALCDGITTAITGVATSRDISPPPPRFRWNRLWLPGVVLVIAVTLGLGLYRESRRKVAPGVVIPLKSSGSGVESATGTVSNEIFDRLNRAQWKGLEMLGQGRPEALEHIEKTLKEADEAVSSFPQQARFHELKGYLQKDVYQSPGAKNLLSDEKRRQYLVQARSSAEQALRINPDSASAHNLMGNVLYFEEDCDGAIKEYDLALRINRNEGYRSVIEGDKSAAVACATRGR